MTETLTFEPATKKRRKARVAIDGPSGSGKTYTALLTAHQLGDRIGVIDTERESASLYSDRFPFQTLPLYTFEPERLVKAVAAASAAAFDVLLIDSLSPFWEGIGGTLEQVDNAAKRAYGGNSFGGWKEATPMQRRMVDAILAYPGHVIVTMRTKTEWVLDENERGRKVPRRVGMKAVQRDGIEYEFDVVGDMDLDHTMAISKTRCFNLADAVIRKPDETFGKTIRAWLEDGAAPAADSNTYRDRALDKDITVEDLRLLHAEVKRAGLLGAAVINGVGDETDLGALIIARAAEQKPAEVPA
jgi:hypothetical protein